MNSKENFFLGHNVDHLTAIKKSQFPHILCLASISEHFRHSSVDSAWVGRYRIEYLKGCSSVAGGEQELILLSSE